MNFRFNQIIIGDVIIIFCKRSINCYYNNINCTCTISIAPTTGIHFALECIALMFNIFRVVANSCLSFMKREVCDSPFAYSYTFSQVNNHFKRGLLTVQFSNYRILLTELDLFTSLNYKILTKRPFARMSVHGGDWATQMIEPDNT